MMPPPTSDDTEAKLLADLDRLSGAPCARCGRPICGHEALFDVALGFKNAAHCLTCLAEALGWGPPELRDHLLRHFEQRDCFSRAWGTAGAREGLGPVRQPRCLWPEGEAPLSPAAAVAPPGGEDFAVSSSWDAGDMACGELVLALRGRMNSLPPGAVLKVTARDPAAPEDLPAWCRLTGHRLLRAAHPDYFLQRKEP